MITFNWVVSVDVPDDKFDIGSAEFSDTINFVPLILNKFVEECNDSIDNKRLGISLRLNVADGQQGVVRRND